ncbi:MAG: butyrate kinase [Chloroflexi bacterium]|nr:butyrate kinase [Chloroflexota bacterium]
MYRLLVINPGSTSSKIAVFEDEEVSFQESITHSPAELAQFKHIFDQHELRREAVEQSLHKAGISRQRLDCVVGRGGILRPLSSGTYRINQRMLDYLRDTPRQHAANLGPVMAYDIASSVNIPAFIVDPISVDEFEPLARVAGLPMIERRSESHALNIKEVARRAAAQLGRSYAEINLVVVHLGGGISVSAHRRGAMVDVNQGLDGTGPFSPERAGGLPVGDAIRMAYSGKYTYDELYRMVTRQGGMLAHLGTNNAQEVEQRIVAGDEHALLIYEAMAYQISKEIGLMATVLKGDVQAIALTGGLAHSEMMTAWIKERVEWIAPVMVFAGQFEMAGLAKGALRVLCGQEQALEY